MWIFKKIVFLGFLTILISFESKKGGFIMSKDVENAGQKDDISKLSKRYSNKSILSNIASDDKIDKLQNRKDFHILIDPISLANRISNND